MVPGQNYGALLGPPIGPITATVTSGGPATTVALATLVGAETSPLLLMLYPRTQTFDKPDGST